MNCQQEFTNAKHTLFPAWQVQIENISFIYVFIFFFCKRIYENYAFHQEEEKKLWHGNSTCKAFP